MSVYYVMMLHTFIHGLLQRVIVTSWFVWQFVAEMCENVKYPFQFIHKQKCLCSVLLRLLMIKNFSQLTLQKLSIN